MEEVYKALDQVIACISESKAYRNCLDLKDRMSHHEEICSLVEKIKSCQKKYIRSGYDPIIKEELDSFQNELLQIPLYVSYQQSLEEVNQMIDYVRDFLNDYFYQLLNMKEKN